MTAAETTNEVTDEGSANSQTHLTAPESIVTEREKALRTTALIVYGLYLASLLFGITSIIGVIVAHIKKGDAADTFVESHFRNAIRTFWISFAFVVVGVVTAFLVVGYFIIVGAGIWAIYRTVKGGLRLLDNKPYA